MRFRLLSCYLFLTILLRVYRKLRRRTTTTMNLATAQSLASRPPLLPPLRPPWSSPRNPPPKPPPSPSSPPSSPTRTQHAGTTSEASPATTSPSSLLRTNPTTRSQFPTSPTSTLGRARAMTWSMAMRWRSLSRCTNHRSVWASWTPVCPQNNPVFSVLFYMLLQITTVVHWPQSCNKTTSGVKSGQHICENQE